MRGDVAMYDAPCANLHEDEHIESSKPSGHHNQEIAGDDGLGMIADKRPPVLRRGPPVAPSLRLGRPIGAHCTWRNIDTQLHRQLCCYTRLSPSRILLCHLHDEFADVLRNSWPPSLRLPFPKQLEALAMPANQRLGFDDYQGLFPIAKTRPDDERETAGVVQSSWLDLPLLIEGQLLSQEQDLRAQGCARAEQETEEKKSIRDQIGDEAENSSSA